MKSQSSRMICTLVLLMAVAASAQTTPAPAPAPAMAGASSTPTMSAAQTAALAGQIAASYNQDIIINADLWSDKPEILSGGLGFTQIIGVSNNTDEADVRAAGGTWRTNITCSNGQPPSNRVLTSASQTTMWTVGYNCTAENYDGLPVCFSWPVLPSSISKESVQVNLSNGTSLNPPCIGLSPNWEFNERTCIVLFGHFGTRVPAGQPGALFVESVEIPKGSSLKLVGPNGPVSAEGLNFTSPSGMGPYNPGVGPYIMVAKLSVLSDVGEGITQPSTTPQTAYPNDGIALYGAYNGSLGPAGNRYRLRTFYSGGMTPDGVGSMQPTAFTNHYYLLANGADGKQVRIDTPGKVYDLGPSLGSVMVIGMADTGVAQPSYDDCYQEDYDNYQDIIIDASSPAAAAAITTLQAFQTDEGYAPVYNPGGPGNDPTPGVTYSSPSQPQTVNITLAIEDPKTVTYCNFNGTLTTDAAECSALVGATA